ncbi:MAG: hypothetical protein RR547_01170, partial [Raoultibacter sp.]
MMKNNYGRIVVGTVAVTSMVLGSVSSAVAATPLENENQAKIESIAEKNQDLSGYSKTDAAEGIFSWDQATITPNSIIKSMFAPAVSALCQATDDFTSINPLQWKLSVSGDVDNA